MDIQTSPDPFARAVIVAAAEEVEPGPDTSVTSAPAAWAAAAIAKPSLPEERLAM
ncbi:hypothetical protein ABIE49_005837 [Bradyrhizobium sp. OAE829]|jgi:hypothetical protein